MTAPTPPAAPAHERASAREKRLTLIACILGSGIVFLDGTVVNVALPAIRDDLNADLAEQQWVIEAYLLTLGSLLLVGGSLDDMFERRLVFGWGVVAFGATSLLCAVAPSAELLIAARAVQGVAGALLVPSTLAIIMATFGPAERGRAIGTWTAWTGGFATVVGPLAGGALIDAASWRWIFLLNVPVALVTLVLIRRAVPRTYDHAEGGHVDVLGGALCAVGLGGVVFALIEQSRLGWSDPAVAGALIVGIAGLAAFVAHERRTPSPMLPLELFRSRNFAVGNFATLTLYAGLGGALFFVGIFLQQVAGYSALEAGAAFMPITAVMFPLSSRFGALADRLGPRWFMAAGPIVAAAGLALLVRVDAEADYVTQLLPALLLFGLGLALTVGPLTATVLGAVDQRHSGVASGVNNAIARVAGLLAIAVLGAFVSAQFDSTVDARLADRPLSAQARAAAEDAKARPLALDAADRLPGGERASVRDALTDASENGFRTGLGLGALLVLTGGVACAVGIQNPRRTVRAEECPAGAICGASQDAARAPEPERIAA